MANEKHLKILNRGVNAWNKWREKNRKTKPDLRDADLSRADLRKANINGAYLSKADLSGANLVGANLSGACLSEAELIHGAWLSYANLMKAELRKADLSGASLQWANLSGVNLSGASLSEAKLHWVKLNGANLSGANLIGVDLGGIILRKTDLSEANLSRANLNSAILEDATLEKAILTGIILYRTITFGWNIKDTSCEYIFLDLERKNRYPKNRNFEPGEFEKLYSIKPQIEFIFKKGLNWADIFAFGTVENNLQNEKPEFAARLISIDRKGTIPRVIFEVASEIIKDEAEKEIRKQYEVTIEALKIESERQYNIIQELLKQPRLLNVGRDYIQSQGDVQITNIEVSSAIEEIKKIVEKEPETTFKGKSKKKILEILNNSLKEVAKGELKETGKKIFELAQTELIPLLPKIVEQIAILKMIGQ